jgi:hypothetical protein
MRKSIASILVAVLATLAATATAQRDPDLDRSRPQVSRGEPGRPLAATPGATPEALLAAHLRGGGKSEQVVASLRTQSRGPGAHGVTQLRMVQEIEGLEVYGAYVRAAVNARGELVHVIDGSVPVSRPVPARIDARQALRAALQHLYPGAGFSLGRGQTQGSTTSFDAGPFFHGQPSATAVVLHLDDGSLARGWLVETWTQRTNELHHTVVSGDGHVLEVERRTARDRYRVFAVDPLATPQAVALGAGAGNAESPIGWLSGPQTTLTIGGNNAMAYLDRNNDNASDGGGTAAGVDFLAAADLAQAPTAGTNQQVAVQNLFYHTNLIHDVLYRYGFNEAAANFQANNFGRGGKGGDPVQAEAQDGSGTDNANFATPRDGRQPRMQMYLWTGGGPTHGVQVPGGPNYEANGADFGPQLTTAGVTGPVATTTPASACTAVGTGVAGKVALVDRGDCEFSTKVLNAQNAGAAAVIVANNDTAFADSYSTMGAGVDAPSVTIPSVMVSYNSGLALKTGGPVSATVYKLAAQPLQIDSALDTDIIYHEVGHGVTWRMVGRMSGPLSGAIGEGFSDGLALLMNSHNDVIGEYSSSSPRGIRRHPYTNYPLTYGDVTGEEVHADGEIYAAIVWKLIQDFGPGRRAELFRYVIDGLNYTRADPAYEDMRDGMLASIANDPNGGDATCALVWNAFARYGVGVGAEGRTPGRRVVITPSSATSSSCN